MPRSQSRCKHDKRFAIWWCLCDSRCMQTDMDVRPAQKPRPDLPASVVAAIDLGLGVVQVRDFMLGRFHKDPVNRRLILRWLREEDRVEARQSWPILESNLRPTVCYL